jgi:hypothetical protein
MGLSRPEWCQKRVTEEKSDWGESGPSELPGCSNCHLAIQTVIRPFTNRHFLPCDQVRHREQEIEPASPPLRSYLLISEVVLH